MIFSHFKKNTSVQELPKVIHFEDIRTDEQFSLVGGKNNSLAKMYQKLTKSGVKVPPGFVVTTDVYWELLDAKETKIQIKKILHDLDIENVEQLQQSSRQIRNIIEKITFSDDVVQQISEAYEKLCQKQNKKNIAVAVRSSATAEDLPEASFAGQQETFLHVRGIAEVLKAAKKCFSSLFTPRAISYRDKNGFDHLSVGLSVGIQEMIDATHGASGVMFTLDTETGFDGVSLITASYGLGEYIVKGKVTPDQFFVFKHGVKKGKKAIISRTLGRKNVKLGVKKNGGVINMSVSQKEQGQFSVSDEVLMQLTKWGMLIEDLYGVAQDIEWVQDGKDGQLYIVQARPETVTVKQKTTSIEKYSLRGNAPLLLEGTAIGQKIGAGKARAITSEKQMKFFKKGEVLVTKNTDPDWEPLMRKASAIITEEGGKTSHAAIVSRELGVPCVVGARNALKKIRNGSKVTVVCNLGHTGYIYKGMVPYEVIDVPVGKAPQTKTKVMMNVADPDNAFSLAHLPHDGIGLARQEFIISNFVRIHPLALIHFDTLKDKKAKDAIKQLTKNYTKKTDYFVDRLAEGIARIAVSAYSKEVVVRLSDLKSNEYARLIGGKQFEPEEQNPMLGWRGASRYYSKEYRKAFKLECEAIKRVRDDWGLDNIVIMIPFCRTPEEGRKVLDLLAQYGLERGKNGLKVYVMCEIPSNVVLAKDFAKLFDGFSIGSNDLTQLSLGVDRDSAKLQSLYDEKDETVKELIKSVIRVAHKHKTTIGFCGQAPSDSPKFADFLIKQGIDSISLNPDTLISGRRRIARVEKKLGGQKSPMSRVYMGAVSAVACIAAVLISVGAGCSSSTLSQNSIYNEVSAIASIDLKNTPADFREKIEQKVRSEINEQVAGQKISFSDERFLGMTLQYPAHIALATTQAGVALTDTKQHTKTYVTQKQFEYAIASTTIVDTITVQGVSAKGYTLSAVEGEIYVVAFTHPNGQEIQISGNDKAFVTEVLSYITFVSQGVAAQAIVADTECLPIAQYRQKEGTETCVLYQDACTIFAQSSACQPE